MSLLRRFAIGKDFTEQDYHRWVEQLVWWISDKFHKIQDPREHAEKILKAAMNGTKLDGGEWRGISHDFFSRVTMLCGFDLRKGVGVRNPNAPKYRRPVGKYTGEKTTDLPPLDLPKAMEMRLLYIQ